MAKRHDVTLPTDLKRCADLSESNPPPVDRRVEIPEIDAEPLATISPMPKFEDAEDAVKMGGKNYSRGTTIDPYEADEND